MHRKIVEVENRCAETIRGIQDACAGDIRMYRAKIQDLEYKLSVAEKEKALAVEAAKNEIRKEMQKALTESDIRRVKAETAYETYTKMDTKEEREHARKMLDKAITALGQKPGIIKA